jgi:hypothetical protein
MSPKLLRLAQFREAKGTATAKERRSQYSQWGLNTTSIAKGLYIPYLLPIEFD